MNARIFSIANQKGGVGKTTTAINLATGLSALGKKTLLIDSDPQGNAGSGLNIYVNEENDGFYEALFSPHLALTFCQKTALPFLDVLPCSQRLCSAEHRLFSLVSPETQVENALSYLRKHYDFIIFDCPPSLGLLTLNALLASDGVIIPVQCEFFAMKGLANFMETLHQLKENIKPSLCLHGILLTMFDKRSLLNRQVCQEIKQHFSRETYQSLIPRSMRVSESASHGRPLIIYDLRSYASHAYMAFVKEFLERESEYERG